MPLLPNPQQAGPALAGAQEEDRLPGGANADDRLKFQKAQSYMVLLDDKAACKNLRCRKRFDISGMKTMAFLADEGLPKEA